MTRRFLAIAVWVACAMLLPLSGPSGAQAPVSSPVPGLPLNQSILRIIPGNGYADIEYNDESTGGEGYLIRGGEPQLGFPADALAWFESFGTRDYYDYYVNLSNVPTTAVFVSIKLITTTSPDAAASMVESYYDTVVAQGRQDPDLPQIGAHIADLPPHDGAIDGWELTMWFRSFSTGGPMLEVPGYRIVGQAGNTLVSASVAGNDPNVSPELTTRLFAAQATCVRDTTPCTPIELPVDLGATPQAIRPGMPAR